MSPSAATDPADDLATGRATDRATVVELLEDLQHDLGKYLTLALRLLPIDADVEALRAAATSALLVTRGGGAAGVSAEALWQHFVATAPAVWRSAAGGDDLAEVVARALAWRGRLATLEVADRAPLEADLGAVATAIRALREEIDDEA